MKRSFLLVFILSLLLIFTACGSNNSESSSSTDNSESPTLGETMKDPEREEEIAEQHDLKIGETGDIDGVKVTLNRVFITEGGEYDADLEPGTIYMVCDLGFENGSQADITPTTFSYELDADGKVCDNTFVSVGESLYNITTIGPGATATGGIAYVVPQDTSKYTFRVKGSVLDDEKDTLVYSFDATQVGR